MPSWDAGISLMQLPNPAGTDSDDPLTDNILAQIKKRRQQVLEPWHSTLTSAGCGFGEISCPCCGTALRAWKGVCVR
jgi:hypothetical protein